MQLSMKKALVRFVQNIFSAGRSSDTAIIVHEADVSAAVSPVSKQTFQGSSVSLRPHPNYRASVKLWWKYYGPFSALDELNKLGLLDHSSAKFLASSISGRTLSSSLDDARDFFRPIWNSMATYSFLHIFRIWTSGRSSHQSRLWPQRLARYP